MMVTIDDIPLFRQIEPAQRGKLKTLFTEIEKSEGDELLTHSDEVDGLYIIVEGEIEIRLPQVETPIARLGNGSYFGEMSFLEGSKTASATVSICSPNAKLLFCERKVLEHLINKDSEFAQSFYESAALTLSNRLRLTNQKINTEINVGMSAVSKAMDEAHITRKIEQTRSDLEETGVNIIRNLQQVFPKLQTSPDIEDSIQKDLAQLQTLILLESQKFDRLSQQLDLIKQHMQNIKRVASGIEPLEVGGDDRLFGG